MTSPHTPPELTHAEPGDTIWYRQGPFAGEERTVVAFHPGDRYRPARVSITGGKTSRPYGAPATWFTDEAPS